MKRLWALFYLWWNGFCTKHMTRKEGVVYDGGVYEWCQQCEDEETSRDHVKIMNALKAAK